MKRLVLVTLAATMTTSLAASIAYTMMARPPEANVHFQESDFVTKPFMREFQWVVVVNRANTGTQKQSIRVYHNQSIVQYEEIAAYMQQFDAMENSNDTKDPNRKDRQERIAELGRKMWSPGVFKVSTGRNAFEAKGEHHSQHDSWSVTPTGFYVPQAFVAKHKSESYSSKMCDSFAAKLVGALLKKQMCTYMENVTFFNGGIGLHKAIPGTEPVLGSKASGGCVRLPAALAEFLYLNFQQAKGSPVPVVNIDGTVKTDASGLTVTESTHHGAWGNLEARSVLIVVEDESQVGGVDYVAPSLAPAVVGAAPVDPSAAPAVQQ